MISKKALWSAKTSMATNITKTRDTSMVRMKFEGLNCLHSRFLKLKKKSNITSGRDRWVVYNKNTGVEYDGSMIPGEWFGWMHHKTDIPPTVVSDPI